MGSTDNANAEWIELYNKGGEVISLSGWTLLAQSGTPSINLSGSIAPGAYFLLERTADTSVPNISADQIYSGALANGGGTLFLKDNTGATIDEVVGGTSWVNIGGDNTTKNTPQRSGTAWVTGTPTPKAQNNSGTSQRDADETQPVIDTNTTPVTFPKLYIEARPGERVFTTKDTVRLQAIVFDKDRRLQHVARVRWAFGDGARETGWNVRHDYQYPGEYVVTVKAEYRYMEAEETFMIRVIDPEVSIGEVSARGIEIKNNSDRMLDLSHWKLISEDMFYPLPEGTKILPKGKVLFPYTVTGIDSTHGNASLMYPSGEVVSVSETNIIQ